ncbi:hypothetical protein [Colwellia sp. PAMC 21821]|uniref:hypothetical protein n=1 Tax=Colwellia sp. PAMC 21821 TaxID=1816219 RepID=UPI0009C03656|nr:hypothetical protein [Colwellia sp. PAMC 21821]ARD45445.1 hypothetical protein A3Q33_14800 [Colwellia sp. PAMC 21821]
MGPIYVPVQGYSGSNKKKQQQYLSKLNLANKIEVYLNERLERHDKGPLVIMFREIASDLNEPLEDIRKIGTAIQGSSNGVTLSK